jgi:hypothetical protein
VTGSILYDNGGSGLAADLTGFGAIQLDNAANDQNTIWSLMLSDGVTSHTESVAQAGGFFGDFSFGLGLFSGAGIDLSNVNSLTLVIDPQVFGGDASLFRLEAIERPTSVADGGIGVSLLGLALLGVAALHRRLR